MSAVDDLVEAWDRSMDPRKQRAALHLLHGMQMRTPVERGPNPRRHPGTLRAAHSVQLTARGFNIVISGDAFWARMVERGHRVGSRRTGQARDMRLLAKQLRRLGKETGDQSLLQRESALRREATLINRQHAGGRQMVEGVRWIEQTLRDEKQTILNILAGVGDG